MSARVGSYWVWLLGAAGLHAGLLFAWDTFLARPPEVAMSAGESIEMTLVEAAGEPEIEAAPPEPEPEPPPPEPEPEPIPEPTSPEPEMVAPSPDPAPPRPASTPRPVRRSATAASSRPASAPKGNPGPPDPTGVKTQAKPNYLRNPRPPYPPAAKAAGEQGTVLLSVSVTEDGRAGSVRLARSSGFPRLDESARTAVQRWRFSPARIGTLAVASEVEVPVRFQIR